MSLQSPYALHLVRHFVRASYVIEKPENLAVLRGWAVTAVAGRPR